MEFMGWKNGECRRESLDSIDSMDIAGWWDVTDWLRHPRQIAVAVGVRRSCETASIADLWSNQSTAFRKNLVILICLKQED